ncbi:gamma-glutamylcyclotransferase family protein [Magnetospirillum molischianum]|uniref:Putative gamma-glutamylcyclotransferase n=1 Tax=Magnetospirillum molischianum DSM 120 TaxID=1150626 RepID=H8FTT5_MAGML|nr:gamma-glutamylcyclotransferase family protein [Magnetospirillum molischianum]CCG41792.1 putative avirulence induced gene (AIG) protein [Magnetospirillum molischianum DSM 120]
MKAAGISMPMFFFGTLMDADVLALVLGHSLDAVRTEPALVRGVRRVHVAGRSYPMLRPHPGGRVEGHLVGGLTPLDRARLAYYEGWEYDVGTIAAIDSAGRMVTAGIYVCPPQIQADERVWRLDRWQSVHKSVYLPRLRLLMDGFDPAATGNDGAKRPPMAPGAMRGRRSAG